MVDGLDDDEVMDMARRHVRGVHTATPVFDPITESTPHRGQSAVWPTPSASASTHSRISSGRNTATQWKQPQSGLARTTAR
jgi:hypothetical protein